MVWVGSKLTERNAAGEGAPFAGSGVDAEDDYDGGALNPNAAATSVFNFTGGDEAAACKLKVYRKGWAAAEEAQGGRPRGAARFGPDDMLRRV